jgi:hypothetical protein
MVVVHSYSPLLIPFAVTRTTHRPHGIVSLIRRSGIRDQAHGKALATTLSSH